MKLYTIDAGHFNADGGACFGIIPKRVWKKRYPCDEDNFCRLTMRCLLIDTGDRRILVDAGAGTKQTDYFRLYGMKDLVDFRTLLPQMGYSCDSITDVVLTHLHFDHCGGATSYSDGKNIELTFKNANYWLAESQWLHSLNPTLREADSYFPENIMPVYQAGRLKLITETMCLTPEVSLKIFNGHTVGQLVVYVRTNKQTVVFAGDVIPTAPNVPLAWVSAYDSNPIISMDEKMVLLEEAVAENQVLVFVHDAYTECATVAKVGERYKVAQTGTLRDFIASYS
jgi:glyoxylase-like metal-dependent hydrolase (beta-lactamase superfamily II)